LISKEQAIAIARQKIVGEVTLLDEDEPVTVTKEDGHYVVTFVRRNPPGTRAADYDARLTIDANSGEVLKFLVAS